MNWVDLVIILLVLLFALEGVGKSFTGEALDFLSFLLAFFVSLRFYPVLAQFFQSNFQIPHVFATVLGFISLWLLVETIFLLIIHLLLSPTRFLTKIDGFLMPLAIVPAALRGLILISIILVLIGSFPIQPKLKSAVEKSKLGSVILKESQGIEKPLKSIFGGVAEESLTFLTIKPKSNESVNLGFQTSEVQPNSSLETQMIELINQERSKAGQGQLNYDFILQEVARSHSIDMFKRGYFSHYSPDGDSVANRAEKMGVKYLVIGENLAYAPSLKLAHEGLMSSPGHRSNILSSDFNKIGIGIIDGNVYGLMITQVFSD